MNLNDRRALEKYKETIYPEQLKAIQTAAKFPIELQVDWEKLAINDYAHLYHEMFTKVYFEPLRIAFEKVTFDRMGTEALQRAIKKVVITNASDFHSAESGVKYDNGVLYFDHRSEANIDQVQERAEIIQKLLENSL